MSGFVISRVQSIALGLNANFTKTAVFCKVLHKSEPNLIILPLLKRAVFLYPKSKKDFTPVRYPKKKQTHP